MFQRFIHPTLCFPEVPSLHNVSFFIVKVNPPVLGGQKKTIIMLFMDKKALKDFQNSDGWKVGADASVALVTIGADGSIDTSKTNQPIVAFVFDQKGLMYNLTLEGAKVSKIKR